MVDLTEFQAGVYFLRVYNEQDVEVISLLLTQ
jgi:hypothetical protein